MIEPTIARLEGLAALLVAIRLPKMVLQRGLGYSPTARPTQMLVSIKRVGRRMTRDARIDRNPTYRRLRAPARQGAYTVGQLVALATAGVLAIVVAAGLVRLGAPVGLALTCGVVIAGAPPTAAVALEGREFSVLGLLRAALLWQRSPRRYAPGASPVVERPGRTHRSNGRHER